MNIGRAHQQSLDFRVFRVFRGLKRLYDNKRRPEGRR